MSQWTKIAGMIRIDDLSMMTGIDYLAVMKKALGEPYYWTIENNDIVEHGDEDTIVPSGSEGTLRYEIRIEPSKQEMARYVVYIWGDLRDFGDEEDIQTIKDWFTDVLENHKLIVRQAILRIEPDNNSAVIIGEHGKVL